MPAKKQTKPATTRPPTIRGARTGKTGKPGSTAPGKRARTDADEAGKSKGDTRPVKPDEAEAGAPTIDRDEGRDDGGDIGSGAD
jgi:hypothetical protein